MKQTPASLRQTLLCGLAGILAAGALALAFTPTQRTGATMLLAPMIGVVEPCILLEEGAGGAAPASGCTGPQGSAATLVESTLASMVAPGTALRYPLGYTLNVPLLQLFKPQGDDWAIDRERVGRLVRTLRDNDRPAVLYFFSNHFATGAPIEAALAVDPRNLSHTRDGPLQRGEYYGSAIHNWSFATTKAPITARRLEAVQAVLEDVCKLEKRHLRKIRGVTLLGELHHLFPDFERGMGFLEPYRVSDYSESSRLGFQEYLRQRFGTIGALNQAMGAAWRSFGDVVPPSKDIRSEPLQHFTEHIDSFAHGSLPIAGWVHVRRPADGPPARISVYRNGVLAGTTTATLGRQDVLESRPELGYVNTGWRFDLDFRQLPPGIHRIDVFLEGEQGARAHLGTRRVAVMDRQQTTPPALPQTALPPSIAPGAEVDFHLDLPVELSSYYHNPLVAHWHAYRGSQVVDYLQFFNQVVAHSCLANTPRYTHQIIPFTNPGWDASKFAIEASLEPLAGLRLGVSLYGEASYGASFAHWLARWPGREYGITEFHPLRPMDPSQLRAVLDRHAGQGARFLSFFLEPRAEGKLLPRGHNIFSLDPENAKYGSDVLYRAMAGAAAQGPPAPVSPPEPAIKPTVPARASLAP